MCGILGSFGHHLTQDYIEGFHKALNLLKHRGPDNLQVWQNTKVILGHTRLSIIDLSKSANQPLADVSERYRIVYNGEIYNYLETKKELESSGAIFRTQSDTEVILESYKRWGPKCLNRFNGMWALAIFDSKESSLFLSRDRYGVKPLYYTLQDGKLCFASEMKALLALGAESKPRWGMISRYLQNWGCDAGSETVFDGIFSLPAGHNLSISAQGHRIEQWWDILEHRVKIPSRFIDRVDYFKELFEDAVRLRLRNDVDTGVSLSGGIDSSAVYGAARKLQKLNIAKSATSNESKKFRLFCVSYPQSPIDEFPWIKKCLEFWNDTCQVSVVYPKPAMFSELIDEVIWHQEAPVWSASVFAFHILYRHIAEQGTKVILEGHGSDEMLGGYPYMAECAAQSFAHQKKIKFAWESAQCLADTKNPALHEISPPSWFIFLKSFFPNNRIVNLPTLIAKRFRNTLSNSLQDDYIHLDIRKSWSPHLSNDNDTNGPLDRELHKAFTQQILPSVLRVFDRATMAYGVESRAPFMDYRIVQFIFSIPEEDKIRRKTKFILRAAAKEWISQDVINRKEKMGFAIDLTEWFNCDSVRRYMADIFHSQDILSSGLFDAKKLLHDVDKCIQSGFSWNDTMRMWEVLNIYLWHKQFVRKTHMAEV